MKIWKISHGTGYFNGNTNALLKSNNLVSLHPDTPAKGVSYVNQGKAFQDAEKFDLFYLCHSNERVDIIGMFIDNRPLYSIVEGHEDWIDREYVLIKQATYLTAYDKDFDRWWSPRNNSTFTEIPHHQVKEFEDKIILPSFKCTYKDILKIRRTELSKLQTKFADLQLWTKEFVLLFDKNKDYLFQRLNSLSQIDLRKLDYELSLRQNIEKNPVVHLRKSILETLIKGENVNSQLIDNIKQEIGKNHDKNVFHVWRDPSRVVYPFFFEPIKKDIEKYLKRGTYLIRKRLGIESYTKSTEFHFDGAQNQGDDRIWFAIYNSSHKNQRTAYQLFFEVFENNVKYGLVYISDHSKDRITIEDNLILSNLIDEYRNFISIIQTDDYKIKEPYIKMKELLELKPQIILQGPPGTGKTYSAKNIAYNLIFDEIISEDSVLRKVQLKNLEESERFKLIQFHPSYSYEDFVRGITVKAYPDGNLEYKTENKVLAEFAKSAVQNYVEHNKDPKLVSLEKWVDTNFQNYIEHLSSKFGGNQEFIINGQLIIKEVNRDLKHFHVWLTSYKKGDFSRTMTFDHLREVFLEYKGNKQRIELESFIEGGFVIDIIKPFLLDLADFCGEPPSFADSQQVLQKNYILIIDEINRANLSSVLGELIYGLEYRNESVESMYEFEGDKKIVLPPNLYIIGTMNTADRSVGHIDYAIRRRFAFKDVLPSQEPIKEFARPLFKSVSELFVKEFDKIDWSNPKPLRSDFIASDFRPEDVWIGHSYFMTKKDEVEGMKELQLKLEYEILPILKEYLKDGILLNSANEIIKKLNVEIPIK